jgi:GT2 family glycosyltransferase
MRATTTEPKVHVVILNWNGRADTIECLETVFESHYGNTGVTVVDNGSSDSSVEQVRAWASMRGVPCEVVREGSSAAPLANGVRLRVLALPENRGFPRGNNAGVRYSQQFDPDYYFIINNDVCVLPETVGTLVREAASRERVGIVWPKVLNPDGSLQLGVTRFPKTFGDIVRTTGLGARVLGRPRESLNGTGAPVLPMAVKEVENFAGCAFLVSAEYVKAHGLFDEETFVIYDEQMLAWRVHHAGYRIFVVPQTVVVHKGRADSRRLGSARVWVEAIRSELRYCRAYLRFSRPQVWLLKAIRVLTFAWRSLRAPDYLAVGGYFLRHYLLA